MKYLKKTWVRVIVSLFGGGMVTEIIHISSGDPNRPRTANLSVLYGVIIYFILTAIVKNNEHKSL